jgi:2-octaprenyl-6-methoxyphenol hydroxylase
MAQRAETQHFDVVIAGGGLVGASLAVALRGSGLSVAVIEPIAADADAQPSFDERRTALAPTSQRFFSQLELWSAIAEHAAPIQRIHVSDQGHGGFSRLDAHEEGLDALGHVVANRVLGHVLRPAMAKAAELFCPAEIIGTELIYTGDAPPSADGTTTATATGRKVHVRTDTGEQTLTTALLVVADGMRSATRDALGVGLDERDYEQSAIIANLRVSQPHGGVAYERFTPNGPLALLPIDAQSMSLVWTLEPKAAEHLAHNSTEAEFLTRLQADFGWRLGRFNAVGERSVYPLTAVSAEQFAVERAVILGNAAHALHPVAGQGFNLALRDVAALAEALGALAETPNTVTDPGEPDRLQDYARSRQSDYKRTFTFTDGLVRVFSNAFLPLVAARNIGLTVLDLVPPARRLLLKQATGAAGNVPSLCQPESLSEEPKP